MHFGRASCIRINRLCILSGACLSLHLVGPELGTCFSVSSRYPEKDCTSYKKDTHIKETEAGRNLKSIAGLNCQGPGHRVSVRDLAGGRCS